MTEHNLFYYPYASFTNAQLPLFKVAALYFHKLVVLDPVNTQKRSSGRSEKIQLEQVANLSCAMEAEKGE